MSRYIDADRLIEELDKTFLGNNPRGVIRGMINNAPTVEVKPTAKGNWILTDGYYCSICNYKLQTTGIPSYCPNCYAEMEKLK